MYYNGKKSNLTYWGRWQREREEETTGGGHPRMLPAQRTHGDTALSPLQTVVV